MVLFLPPPITHRLVFAGARPRLRFVFPDMDARSDRRMNAAQSHFELIQGTILFYRDTRRKSEGSPNSLSKGDMWERRFRKNEASEFNQCRD